MKLSQIGECDLKSAAEALRMRDAELAPRFAVIGRFYEIEGKEVRYPCRDVLEITRAGRAEIEPCDAIFVMMNPGGSKPRKPVTPSLLGAASMVPTEPDVTQYQLMRLMEAFQWGHVRVLNLSDLREPESKKLPQILKRFQDDKGHDGHSVFSPLRKASLSLMLARKPGALVFIAWGVSPRLKELAQLALSSMRAQGVTELVGLRHPSSRDWAYYHPLPPNATRRKDWCRGAVALIDAQRRAASCP